MHYTIAHLKLSQYLADKDHSLKDGERLQVFLTNTLEPMEAQKNLLLPALSQESVSAQRVKERPILVITGNPPYSGHSKNKGAWITASIEEYRKGFPELYKPGQGKWLQDDYVKFIRFAQMKMDGGVFKVEDEFGQLHEIEVAGVDEGIVGVITNHSWLDNPTFRGMRKSLMRTFDQIYVIDLHGNAKKKERTPDGGEDKNVFDIEQGVAISLFVKKHGAQRGVFHSEVWGSRLSKYQYLAETAKGAILWQPVEPLAPGFIFRHQNRAQTEAYQKLWSVPKIFAVNGDPAPGIVTTHDQFAVSFTQQEAVSKVELFLQTVDEADARRRFRLCTQSQWNYEDAKEALQSIDIKKHLVQIRYRPFDTRWTIWDSHVAVHRRERVMRHMFFDNVGLVTSRLTKGEIFRHALVVDAPIEAISLSPKTSNNGFLFPLYLYPRPKTTQKSKKDLFGDNDPFAGKKRIENVASDFRKWLDEKYENHFSPEELFGYVYAVLHAPNYRTKYAEFLRNDFPRIPFPDARKAFEALSALGWELVQKHLFRDVPALKLGTYRGKGSNEVEKPRYVEQELAVYINATQSFAPMPVDVWNFHVGGYPIIDKYLKSRKGRTLSLDEIQNVENVVNVLAFTIEQMTKIDEAYRQAFGS